MIWTLLTLDFRSACLLSATGSIIVYVALLFTGGLISRLFLSDTVTIDYVVQVMPMYAFGFIMMALNTLISTYLYSTKRTIPAVILNVLRSFVFTTAVILVLPKIFGTSVIWSTFTIHETLSLILGIALIKISERNGIVYR